MPTEAEFEFAARGGLQGKTYVWGDDFKPGGKWMANTYQGTFPVKDQGGDGFVGLAPVAKFPPNGYGLYDMSGNVWQWCSDWYRPDYYPELADKAGGVTNNPQGPDTPFDPAEPNEKKRVHRGGSFLCNDQYCSRYIVGTRGKGDINTGTNHLGFRCVKSADQKLQANADKASARSGSRLQENLFAFSATGFGMGIRLLSAPDPQRENGFRTLEHPTQRVIAAPLTILATHSDKPNQTT